jgi:hypothetical protein
LEIVGQYRRHANSEKGSKPLCGPQAVPYESPFALLGLQTFTTINESPTGFDHHKFSVI